MKITKADYWKRRLDKQKRVIALAALALGFLFCSFTSSLAKQKEHTNLNSEHSNMLTPELLGNDFFASPLMFDKDLVAFFNHELQLPLLHPETFVRRKNDFFMPHCNIQEDGRLVTVTLAVPDIPLEDIHIEVLDGSVLRVAGGHSKLGNSVQFEKIFALGRHIDSESIQATLSHGELKITTPRKRMEIDNKNTRKIDVKTEL